MAAFATSQELEQRWRTLTVAEHTQATALLEDVSAMIRALVPTIDDRLVSGDLDAAIPRMVAVAAVKRAMQSPQGMEGVSAVNQTAGPFSQNTSFANPGGNLWLTRTEKLMLGASGQRAFTVDMAEDARWPASGLEET